MYVIRKVREEEIHSALNLALRVFMEYEAPLYGETGTQRFISDCIENDAFTDSFILEKNLMLGALAGERIVGMVAARGKSHISMLFVDGGCHRKGIATALMKEAVMQLAEAGAQIITLNSSPYGAPFYHAFGFTDTDCEQTNEGIIFTPMEYKIKKENGEVCFD